MKTYIMWGSWCLEDLRSGKIYIKTNKPAPGKRVTRKYINFMGNTPREVILID